MAALSGLTHFESTISQFVRTEERAGVRRMELAHDLWTKSIVRSRDERRHAEEIEARERARRAELEAAARNYAPVRLALERLRDDLENGSPESQVAASGRRR